MMNLFQLQQPGRQRKRSVVDAYRDKRSTSDARRRVSGEVRMVGYFTNCLCYLFLLIMLELQLEQAQSTFRRIVFLILPYDVLFFCFVTMYFDSTFRKYWRFIFQVRQALENEHLWSFDVLQLERVSEHHALSQLALKVRFTLIWGNWSVHRLWIMIHSITWSTK